MLQHADIWRAIDQLAARNGLTPSALARKAGLDATAFNKSKRVTTAGKKRWPGTESIAKILAAVGVPLRDFVALVEREEPARATAPDTIPIIGGAQAGADGDFDAKGRPLGKDWDEVDFPDLDDPYAFALEIAGDALEPVYYDGDMIVVSPSSGVRRGDRVVVRTSDGEILIRTLRRKSARRVDLLSIQTGHRDVTLPIEDVSWMHRVVWASQ